MGRNEHGLGLRVLAGALLLMVGVGVGMGVLSRHDLAVQGKARQFVVRELADASESPDGIVPRCLPPDLPLAERAPHLRPCTAREHGSDFVRWVDPEGRVGVRPPPDHRAQVGGAILVGIISTIYTGVACIALAGLGTVVRRRLRRRGEETLSWTPPSAIR